MAFSVISRDLALVALIVFLMWRTHEPLKRLGLTRHRLGQEALLGLALFVPFFVWMSLVAALLRSVAEEVLFRGYLLLRFRALLSNTAAAVVISALIFALGHGYEGAAGVITVGVMGVIFSVLLWWRRSLVAPITVHFLQNLMGVVILPSLDLI